VKANTTAKSSSEGGIPSHAAAAPGGVVHDCSLIADKVTGTSTKVKGGYDGDRE